MLLELFVCSPVEKYICLRGQFEVFLEECAHIFNDRDAFVIEVEPLIFAFMRALAVCGVMSASHGTAVRHDGVKLVLCALFIVFTIFQGQIEVKQDTILVLDVLRLSSLVEDFLESLEADDKMVGWLVDKHLFRDGDKVIAVRAVPLIVIVHLLFLVEQLEARVKGDGWRGHLLGSLSKNRG